ncbi:MAG: response regulator transcription factor [Lachnospiraceae bacterium]|nr:response regulator transcription factor [Lachnospiraceae bacterium]
MIKVVIADDMQILRQGLKAILEQDDDIEVVALASDGREAYEKVKINKADLVLMDMRMPKYDGAYGINLIKEHKLKTKVLVLTTFDDDETVTEAVNSGADGYILKEIPDEQVIAAVKQVSQGIGVFGGTIYQTMRQKLVTVKEVAKPEQFYSTEGEEIVFSERELEFLKLVALGYDNKEMASEMYLAEGTVRNQLSKLMDKVQVKDRTQLAVYSVKNGLDE